MQKLVYPVLFLAAATGVAVAQTPAGVRRATPGVQTPFIVNVHHEDADTAPPVQMLTSLPSNTWPISDWYKQSVYDRANNEIGEMLDVLVDHDGSNVAIIIGVGGFLGVGEKDVAVPFNAVHFKKKDNGGQAVINTTKETLRNAPAYKYDRNARNWVPDHSSGTTGGANTK
jgi:hypothetical protein